MKGPEATFPQFKRNEQILKDKDISPKKKLELHRNYKLHLELPRKESVKSFEM